jgi:hypothetical protein
MVVRVKFGVKIAKQYTKIEFRRKDSVSEMLCVLNENRKVDNVQNHSNCINMPSSQT